MNEKLPKPMLDALAREAAPAKHPTADVLAAFMERALAEAEERSVSDHLAGCGECREVVFLASAAEEEALEQEVAVAAAAKAIPRRRWMPHLAWALSVAAAVVLVGGYFVRERSAMAPARQELASKKAAEPVMEQSEQSREVTAAPSASSMVTPPGEVKSRPAAGTAMTLPAKKAQPASADMVAVKSGEAAKTTELDTTTETAKAAPTIVIGGALPAAAPTAPKSNGFVPSQDEAGGQYSATPSLGYSVNRALQAAHADWRVTAQGQLEHLTPDGWTRVLADHASAFRAVSVVGGGVWAGGDRGALFHSSDEGQHWKKVSLNPEGGTESAAIVTIRFADPRHGVVTTDSGSSYATADGGVTWTKQ